MIKLACIIIVLLPIVTFGQDDRVLTFSDAVEIALENNISLKQTQNELKANQMQKYSSLADMAPRIWLRGVVRRTDGNSFNQQEGRVVNGVLDFADGSVEAQMPLFDGFNRLNAYKQSNAQVESQAYAIKRTQQDVIRDVANQYLQCLLDQEFLAINEQNLATQQRQLEQLAGQVEAGSMAKVDQINQEFQVKNAELLVLRAKITLRNDKAALSEVLQIDPSSSFEVATPNLNVNSIDIVNYELEELYAIAADNRSDLLQTQKLESVSKFALKSSRGAYLPTLSAFFSYGSAYNQLVGTPDSVARDFRQQFFTDNLARTFGLSIRVPIFEGLGARNQVVRARVNYQNATLNTQNLDLTVKSDVLRAHQGFQDAMLNYQASQAQLDAASLSFSLQKESFELGASDFVAYTLANRDYLNAQSTFAQAKYTLMFQEVLLKYAIGTLNFDELPK